MHRAPPPARLLDLTRLVSRAGRVLTGVDRVERAYATELAQHDTPVWGLVRSSLGHLLLDRAGIRAILAATQSGEWGQADMLSRLSRRLDRQRQAGQSLARAQSVARCLPSGLGRMLARRLPPGTTYLNIGHSNLTAACLRAVRHIPGARITVMIHDTIPLDFPQFQRPGSVAPFAAKLAAAARADLILCPSEVSKGDVARHLGTDAPRIVVVPLGHSPTVPVPADLPAGLPPTGDYFVCLGTIEPRKNHALLLDVWSALGPAAPTLVICGTRGWANADVLARLNRAPPAIIEATGLSDGAVAALLRGARALLFPSFAEGFGLPLVEATALGCPVICSDLAICHEVLGDRAVYLPPTDAYLWQEAIEAVTVKPHKHVPEQAFFPRTWDDHFKTVLSMS